MLTEIITFELKYRAKRVDTYLYFVVLFLFSIVAVDFIFDGNLGAIRKNAPVLIAKTMTITTALFIMMVSMIMGVAALRDFDHRMESLMFVNPIRKSDYVLGRFFGAFIMVLLIFSALPLGMMLGELMPWRVATTFHAWYYIQPFLGFILPTLFFSSALFFIGGALSRKLIVVYTQGIVLLMVYLLTLQISKGEIGQFWTALLDPFSFQAIGIATSYWTAIE